MANSLLIGKLYVPLARSPLVKRDRCLEKLNQGLKGKLILISAAAGFGKTTVLSAWAQQTQLPVGWLALDERDNDSARFWTYIVAALQRAGETVGEATLSILKSAEASAFEVFLTPLLNELSQLQTALILSLDDYHLITDPAIHSALTFFLEHLPPQVHLAIATRTDPPLPLAKLRACSQLTELRSTDLRFTDEEATAFMAHSLSRSLTAAQVAALQSQTEGWIAGLQLAMLLLREAPEPLKLIDAVKGNQRYILDYLAEEVLERQSPALQTFLLRTSVLEQMCGSLCEAVVGEAVIGEASIEGIEALEQIERHNLFVVPLDSDRTWYRYHHLFAESLRHILQRTEPDRIRDYHDRAAQWYEQQGYISEAIQHATAAQSFEHAASLIEQEIQTRDNPRFDTVIVRKALAEFPSELVYTHPWLLVAKAWVGFTSSRFAEAITAIQTLEQLLNETNFATENTDRLWGVIIALKGMQARQQGDMADSVSLLEKALTLLPRDNSWLRSQILLNLGVTYFVADNDEAAKQLLPEVSRVGRVRGTADPAIAGLYLQAQFLVLRGRMDEATSLCRQGLELATERRWLATYAGVLVQVAIADLLREQNQLEAAAQHLNQSIERAIQNQQPGLMMGYITLARVRQAQGDFPAAWDALHAAEGTQPWSWPTILSVQACKARLYLAEGNLNGATIWAKKSGLSVEGELHYSPTAQCPMGSELDTLTYARVLIAQGRKQSSCLPNALPNALRLLTRLYEFAKAGGRTIRVMETLLLQALVLQAQGDSAQALVYLNQALNISGHGSYIRLFLDEGQPMVELLKAAVSKGIHSEEVHYLLAAFGSMEKQESEKQESATVQLLAEPLTERELEVLAHLATGMTNQAIANQLFVSLAAIKWHARNIYGKLEVNNRTQAVAKARELNLLP